MREIQGQATELVPAPADACLALLAAVEHYPNWFPEMVRSVDVLERDGEGQAVRVHTLLHVARGPLSHDFDLEMAVEVAPPGSVALTKVGGSQQVFAVTWLLQEQDQRTRLELSVDASLEVSRFVPLGGVGDAVAASFAAAARRALA